MVDMRIIWKAQLDLCKAIADDIVKHNASKRVCQYADGFAMIESPYGTRGGYDGNDFVRINFGEAYAYVYVGDVHLPTGEVSWNNDEMGVKHDTIYDGTIDDLEAMSLEEAYENCEYPDCYEEYEGKETEYANGLKYIPYNN